MTPVSPNQNADLEELEFKVQIADQLILQRESGLINRRSPSTYHLLRLGGKHTHKVTAFKGQKNQDNAKRTHWLLYRMTPRVLTDRGSHGLFWEHTHTHTQMPHSGWPKVTVSKGFLRN